MAPGETGLLTRNPWVARRPLTVAEYHRMGEVGILTEDDRVELIEGELCHICGKASMKDFGLKPMEGADEMMEVFRRFPCREGRGLGLP